MYTSSAMVFVLSVLRVTVIRLVETPKYILGEGKDEVMVENFHKLATKYNRPCTITVEELAACGTVASAHGKSRASFGELTVHFRGLFATKTIGFSTVLIWLSWTMIGLAYPLFYVFLPFYLQARGAATGDTSKYDQWRNYAIVNVSGSKWHGSKSIPETNINFKVFGPILAGHMCNWRVLGRKYTMVIGSLVTSKLKCISTCLMKS